MTSNVTERAPVTMKDLKGTDPRWCTGCGDYTILVGLRKFMVNRQIMPEDTVNVSGIGCSGRIPHYMNTYGIHSIHGRAIPVSLGIALAKPELKVFIHSGDGDSLSIGGNHLIHGITKNFNCVYLLFDNQIYGLTKNQTSPTTQKGLTTQTQPTGSYLDPINPIRFALGLGASFVASTAEWMGKHFVDTLDMAFQHEGFSFVHIAQRCPKFNPAAWDYKNSSWLEFLTHETALAPDLKGAPDGGVIEHDPTDYMKAVELSRKVPSLFGLFYREEKPMYDKILLDTIAQTEKKDQARLLDDFVI
ncbi:2-oxoacid:ferredoxin oxidoreductase subunit beta [Candidatus Marinamargulisbacteria bacterium SCGC AG-414-C22]|nr:2-oxoacid:ferredoxin oxidoreductase subunit beta [Candidatus Marinamargulisbacteria bacterium SCGC AG-414-C22]